MSVYCIVAYIFGFILLGFISSFVFTSNYFVGVKLLAWLVFIVTPSVAFGFIVGCKIQGIL